MIRPEVEHRHMQLPQHALRLNTAVVVCIVKHEYCALAPLSVERVKVLHKLHHEQTECVAVGDASVRGVPDLARAAHPGDEVERLQVRAARDLVAAKLGHPPTLAMIGPLEH